MELGKKVQQNQQKKQKVEQKKQEIKKKQIQEKRNAVQPEQKKDKIEILKKSKKIKKEKKPIKVDEKRQSRIKPIIEDFSQFIKQKGHKLEKIKERTISMIKLEKEQVKTAVKSLLKYIQAKKSKNNLLEQGDDFIYLEIILSQVPEKYSIRPIQIPLPVPIYSEDLNSKFCIFVKDPQRAYKDKIASLNIPNIARVLGISKIDQKYPTYKEKRDLFYSYDLFFCDYKIYDLLKKPTGKIFYERKKIPFPIDCEKVPEHVKEQLGSDSYETYLNDLKNYTYLVMGNGPVYTVKVARENMNVKDCVKNIINGVYNTIPHLIANMKNKHTNVRQICIKTYNSISLPIYSQLTEEESQIAAKKI